MHNRRQDNVKAWPAAPCAQLNGPVMAGVTRHPRRPQTRMCCIVTRKGSEGMDVRLVCDAGVERHEIESSRGCSNVRTQSSGWTSRSVTSRR